MELLSQIDQLKAKLQNTRKLHKKLEKILGKQSWRTSRTLFETLKDNKLTVDKEKMRQTN